MTRRIVIATGNPGKLREFATCSRPSVGSDPQTELKRGASGRAASHVLENALAKARHAASVTGCQRSPTIRASARPRCRAHRACCRRASPANRPTMRATTKSCCDGCGRRRPARALTRACCRRPRGGRPGAADCRRALARRDHRPAAGSGGFGYDRCSSGAAEHAAQQAWLLRFFRFLFGGCRTRFFLVFGFLRFGRNFSFSRRSFLLFLVLHFDGRFFRRTTGSAKHAAKQPRFLSSCTALSVSAGFGFSAAPAFGVPGFGLVIAGVVPEGSSELPVPKILPRSPRFFHPRSSAGGSSASADDKASSSARNWSCLVVDDEGLVRALRVAVVRASQHGRGVASEAICSDHHLFRLGPRAPAWGSNSSAGAVVARIGRHRERLPQTRRPLRLSSMAQNEGAARGS